LCWRSWPNREFQNLFAVGSINFYLIDNRVKIGKAFSDWLELNGGM